MPSMNCNATIPRREFSSRLVLGAAALVMPTAYAVAASYPSRLIRCIVPFATGGGTDVIGRPLIQAMAEDLGQAMILDNKPGAGTVIGSDMVAKAVPDGHTLLINTSALAINASLVSKLPYDTLVDLSPVGRICHGPNVIAVRADSPIKSVADLLRLAAEKPGKLSYASSGNGSAVHLAAELFKLMAKVQIQHIPYRGAGPAYTDLLGGQVDMLFGTAGGTHKFVKSGQMRAIAVTSASRVDAYPGIPCVAETLPGYAAEVWYGMFVPKATPSAIVERLSAALRKAADLPAYKAALQKDGLTSSVNSPAEMAAFMATEVARWRKVVVEAKVTTD
jgi:tripartite-type tricarboxylate transporter receptor subunit TctC